MCGIVGYLDRNNPISSELLSRMRDTLAHRGPDDAGNWLSHDRTVGLSQRRLAIVDLSPLGHQPMLSPDGRYVIVLNGEIYNFREIRAELEAKGVQFRGHSDTEVMLAAYAMSGPASLEQFRGMFAVVIFDTLERTLFAARDRAGEKPFFYRHDGTRLVFASELKALFAHPDMPRKLSMSGLNQYLAFGYVPREQCILEGYKKLPAGHQMVFELETGKLTVAPYWSLPRLQQGPFAPFDEQVDKLEALLRDSVKDQLMADVPVGVLLSGGLDSSLVAATAARAGGSRIRTYSIGFPGHAAFDETAFAKLVADYLGSEHTLLPAEQDTVSILPKLIGQFDEPIADSSMIPTFMVSQAIRQHCTVAVGGDGGDELFGGYLHYGWVERVARMRGLQFHRLRAESALSRLLPIGTRGRSLAFALAGRYPAEVTLNRLLDPALRHGIMNVGGDLTLEEPEAVRNALLCGRSGALNRLSALDFQAYMCDDILVKVDRASMLTSLEVRAPFLDQKIVEFAFGEVPSEHKVANGQRKRLLRALAGRLLPPNFNSARKQGFSIPLHAWLNGQWKPLVDDLLESGSPLFERKALDRALKQWRSTERGATRIFQLVVLEGWRRQFAIQL